MYQYWQRQDEDTVHKRVFFNILPSISRWLGVRSAKSKAKGTSYVSLSAPAAPISAFMNFQWYMEVGLILYWIVRVHSYQLQMLCGMYLKNTIFNLGAFLLRNSGWGWGVWFIATWLGGCHHNSVRTFYRAFESRLSVPFATIFLFQPKNISVGEPENTSVGELNNISVEEPENTSVGDLETSPLHVLSLLYLLYLFHCPQRECGVAKFIEPRGTCPTNTFQCYMRVGGSLETPNFYFIV